MQQLHVLEQSPAGRVLLLRAEPGVLQALQLFRHPPQAGGDRPPPGLGRVRGEDGMDAQVRQPLLHVLRARHRRPQVVPGIGVGCGCRGVEQAHPVPLVGEVDQVQVHGDGPGQPDGVLGGERGQVNGIAVVMQLRDLIGDGLQASLPQNLFVHAGQQAQFPGEFAVHGLKCARDSRVAWEVLSRKEDSCTKSRVSDVADCPRHDALARVPPGPVVTRARSPPCERACADPSTRLGRTWSGPRR